MRESKKRANIGICLILAGLMAFCIAGCDSDDDDDTQTLTGNEIILINLGDSYTNGVQAGSGNINQYTQVNGFAQQLADQMGQAVTLKWGNPLLSMNKMRLDTKVIPHNVGVDGATAQSLVSETTAQNPYMNELLQPIPEKMGRPITQLEAAVYVANLYPNNLKIFTLWISGNDVMGIVNAGGGTELTAAHINAFLSDTDISGKPLNEGHDLDSVKANLTTALNTLTAVPNSHVFMANIASVAGIAGLFNQEDIERLAVFDNPDVTVLAEGEHMGFAPFAGFGYFPALSQTLSGNNTYLNAAIQGTLASGKNDAFSLTSEETAIIDARVAAINAHIASLADANANVTPVDFDSFFDAVKKKEIMAGGKPFLRSYHGGLFSPDGFHPSNTGYAMMADEFIRGMNETNIIAPIPRIDIDAVWASDPYQDKDGDGYAPGPADPTIMDSIFIPLMDCDDTDSTVVAPSPVAGYWGYCGT